MFKEITPAGYAVGALMFKRAGRYYFMWSEGGWTGLDYRVSYAIADAPLGPFETLGTILAQDSRIAHRLRPRHGLRFDDVVTISAD